MAIIGEMECPQCHGKGKREDGSACEQCGGSGSIPVYDDPDDERRSSSLQHF